MTAKRVSLVSSVMGVLCPRQTCANIPTQAATMNRRIARPETENCCKKKRLRNPSRGRKWRARIWSATGADQQTTKRGEPFKFKVVASRGSNASSEPPLAKMGIYNATSQIKGGTYPISLSFRRANAVRQEESAVAPGVDAPPAAQLENRESPRLQRIIPRPMPLASGTKLGPYEVQSAAGAGGMGEVYKARDTR